MTPPAHDPALSPRRPEPPAAKQGRPAVGRARRALIPVTVGLAAAATAIALFGVGPVTATAAGAAIGVLSPQTERAVHDLPPLTAVGRPAIRHADIPSTRKGHS